MADVQLGLGSFRFGLSTAAWQSLRQQAGYRWASQARIGRPPALQFLGEDTGTITVTGVIMPFYRGGLGQMGQLRAQAGKGEPMTLVDGMGNNLGQWVIESVEEEKSNPHSNGAARKIDFTITLKTYGDDNAKSLYTAPGIFLPKRASNKSAFVDAVDPVPQTPGRVFREEFGVSDADQQRALGEITASGVPAAESGTLFDHTLALATRMGELAGRDVGSQARRAALLAPGNTERLAVVLNDLGVMPGDVYDTFQSDAVQGLMDLGGQVATSDDPQATARGMLSASAGQRLAAFAVGSALGTTV